MLRFIDWSRRFAENRLPLFGTALWQDSRAPVLPQPRPTAAKAARQGNGMKRFLYGGALAAALGLTYSVTAALIA